MASGPWRALAEQFQVICSPGGPPGAGPPGALPGRVSCGHWGVTSFRCPYCPDIPWLWQELCKLSLFSDEDQATLEAQILAQEGARGSSPPVSTLPAPRSALGPRDPVHPLPALLPAGRGAVLLLLGLPHGMEGPLTTERILLRPPVPPTGHAVQHPQDPGPGIVCPWVPPAYPECHTRLGCPLEACLEYCMTFCDCGLKTAMAHYLQHGDLVHGGYGSHLCPVSPRKNLCGESRACSGQARGMQLLLGLAPSWAEHRSRRAGPPSQGFTIVTRASPRPLLALQGQAGSK
ncbi:uncharacterized protein LOC122457366 isoform X2 [Dermochelys coriacea]|uniref:uncharacterized protein LOC122457366 isoform X2 n=1 Tax=Dermochelys coriacea TaxID=27794 RepID=UPI001CA81D5D|nr:uncharacterized protein LOC122457366 isoform X2 [Dermochelys coriacea]